MHIYFSTNAIPAENWERIHEYLDEFDRTGNFSGVSQTLF